MPRAKPLRRQVSTTKSIPAPVGGLNAVDSIAAMPPEDAVILDNWFPTQSYITVRNGSESWATGLPSLVESLMPYANAAGEKLFAASGTAFYNVTLQTAVGAAVVTGLSNARWESTNLATSAGQYMYAANGVDKPRLYDGTAWTAIDSGSTPAITGVTTTKLRNPIVWKNRLWFVEEGSLNAWYLPIQSIGGAASKWDLTTIFALGGKLQAIMTASVATSSVFDDYIAFITTEGQIAIYAGTDPATAGLFVLQGIYQIGRPIGRRCFSKMGADSFILCSDGLVSLSGLVRQGRGKKTETLSYKIQKLINDDIQNYGSNFGWEGAFYPLGNKFIVNVPKIEGSVSMQYVMNTLTSPGAWCTYGYLNSPWNAFCFGVLGDMLFWGGNTIVYRGDKGTSDGESPITASVLPAFSYFGTDRQKMFTMARPLLTATVTATILGSLNVDFNTNPPTGVLFLPASLTSLWDVSPWDTTPWAAGLQIRSQWKTAGNIGFTASFYIKTITKYDTINLNSIDYVFMPGGIL